MSESYLPPKVRIMAMCAKSEILQGSNGSGSAGSIEEGNEEPEF